MNYKLLVPVAIALASTLNPALAVEYRITATGATTPTGSGGTQSLTTSNFTVIFDDTSGDGLL